MRMFLYYALHSLVNQIRKIFKTWVMIFILVCFAFGIGIGLFAATMSDLAEKNKEETEITETVDSPEDEDETPEEEKPNLIRDGIGYANFVELIAAAIVIISFSLSVMNADKNAGRIFLPADVTLLFAAPLKPQSVMLFRIGTQIGAMLFMGVYLLFQLPNLVLNVGLSLWAGIAIIVAFSLMTFIGTLLQLLAYLLSSKYEKVKKMLRPGLITVLALIAGSFFTYQKTSGLDRLTAASNFFNTEAARYIPFWGWLKGFVRAAIDGELVSALIFLGLIILGAAILIWFMWRLKVDFYEDAMAKSEEVAELLEAARSKNAGLVVKRKKDRSEKLRRENIGRGWGANVFFFKNMYNRFRFAHFGFFTKTMEFNLCAAIATALVCRYAIETKAVILLAAVFGVITFMRSLGNVLEQDTKMDYFVMIPESAWAKMFFSMLAEITGAFIDLSIPMVLGALIMGGNPLEALAWTVALLSISIYSMSVGTFIGVTVPNQAGSMVKQFVQVMFVYFGLLPDIVILSICAVIGKLVLGVALAISVNVLLGLLFFALAARFLEPHGGTEAEAIL